jgi:hypothetical protein
MPPSRRIPKKLPAPRIPPSGSVPGQQPPPPPRGDDDDYRDDEDFDDDYDRFGDFGFDDPGSVYTSNAAYNSAVGKAELARTRYVIPLCKAIDKSTLMPDTRATLKVIVHGLFDKTAVLAKITNLNVEEIDAEIALAQAKVGFHPSDVDNPDLATIYNMVRLHYRQYISRALHGWERGLQNVMETASTQRLVDTRFQQPMGQQGGGQKLAWYNPKRWLS